MTSHCTKRCGRFSDDESKHVVTVLSSALFALCLMAASSERVYCQGAYDILARSGTAAPDGNGVFSNFGGQQTNDYPVLSDSGEVAFFGVLSGTAFGQYDDRGIFQTSAGQVIQLAREGDATPGGGGGFLDFMKSLTVSDTGEVAFWSFSRNAAPQTDTALYQANNGPATLLAREGGSAPGGGTFRSFATPIHTGDGQIAFTAELSVGGISNGIFRQEDGTLSQVVRNGQTVPDGDGTFYRFSSPSISSSNQMAFRSTAAGLYWGVFKEADGVITRVAKTYEPAPDGNGTFWDFGAPVISDANEVAFKASLKNFTGGIGSGGIFRTNGTSIEQIARTGGTCTRWKRNYLLIHRSGHCGDGRRYVFRKN